MDEKFVDAMLQTIVMFQKGYKTFKAENKNLSEAEVMTLTDIWWSGLMKSVVNGSKNTEGGLDGFDH